jgi:S-adenosylmethionine synthetase
MKEFGEVQHKTEIVVSAEQSYKKEFIGTLKIKPGHKLFRMDLRTLKIEEVNIDQLAKKAVLSADLSHVDVNTEIILENKLYRYDSALNQKNAAKKFSKFIETALANDPKKIKEFHEAVKAQLYSKSDSETT